MSVLSPSRQAEVDAYLARLHAAHVAWIGNYIEWSSLGAEVEPERKLAVQEIAKLREEIARVHHVVDQLTRPRFFRPFAKGTD